MACQTTYAWSHNFPRLAAESGFTFNTHRPRVLLDWNRIRLIDIEGLIRDRSFQTVEQHINDVLECSLESEFDVRILDAGVVKLFRLAQLAVEYQQFCRQYLERSVLLLRDELAAAMQVHQECSLESEFDVRILDAGVVKLFRLAQLAVEYQQFCRQYLERSVLLLRDELAAAMQVHQECSLESEFDVRILDAGVVKLFRLAQLAVEYQQFCRQYLERSVLLLRDELAAAMQVHQECSLESEYDVRILDAGVVKLFRLAQLAVEYQQFCRQYLERSVLLLRDELAAAMQVHQECSLESEYDVRILDAGVVKLFRLAQLAVEYQQRLERSVLLLRDELAAAMQELEKMRREIRTKDEEIRKMRRKPKAHRTPLPYGNENIATMILRTLSNRGDIFAGTSIGEAVPHYNKCQHCEKVFLNQLYLQSHIARRHPDLTTRVMVNVPGGDPMAPDDLPEKMSPKTDVDNNQGLEVVQLRNEVRSLQDKLRETEAVLSSKPVMENLELDKKDNDIEIADKGSDDNANVKLLGKFEEWKQQESNKYLNEIGELRKQLVENMNAFKETVLTNAATNDNRIVEQLKETVKRQENQILQLKEEISKVSRATEARVDTAPELRRHEEAEEAEEAWRRRAEALERQHERKLARLLRALAAVHADVKAARELAEAERARALQLDAALAERDAVIRTLRNAASSAPNKPPRSAANTKTMDEVITKPRAMQTAPTYNDLTSKQTLLELHRKAQELLNRNTESDSETSDTIEEPSPPDKRPQKKESIKLSPSRSEVKVPTRNAKSNSGIKSRQNKKKKEVTANRSRANLRRSGDAADATKIKIKKSNRKGNISSEDSEFEVTDKTKVVIANHVTSSPVKVVRAKLAEEVNSRLQGLGVDPLRRGVSADAFRRQRSQLQHSLELKAKTDSNYSKMRNRIMTYLDSKVTKETELVADVNTEVSPSKQPKNLKVFSIFSNVKHKALSLMKPSDKAGKVERTILNDDISRRAAQLLKTPPGSAPSSPAGQRRPSLDSRSLFPDRVKRALSRMTSRDSPIKTPPPKSQSVEVLFHKNAKTQDSNGDMSESEATSSLDDYGKKSGVKVVTSAIAHGPSKSIESLMKSPIRKPAMFNGDGNISATSSPIRPASATPVPARTRMYDVGTDSDGSEVDVPVDNPRKFQSEETLATRSSPTSTKGVLKNAPSISSLSKKKVLFDLEANQMKSVSASPSQSVTEGHGAAHGNDANEDQINNVNNDWEISSIEDIPVKEVKTDDTSAPDSRRSPKIAELTQRIESQLARRPDVRKPVGAVEVMTQNHNASNVFMSGSNTSAGSSMLDDSNEFEVKNVSPGRSKTPVPAPRYVAKHTMDKDASDLDVSDWSIDDILRGK